MASQFSNVSHRANTTGRSSLHLMITAYSAAASAEPATSVSARNSMAESIMVHSPALRSAAESTYRARFVKCIVPFWFWRQRSDGHFPGADELFRPINYSWFSELKRRAGSRTSPLMCDATKIAGDQGRSQHLGRASRDQRRRRLPD